jgi:hypothetical protein
VDDIEQYRQGGYGTIVLDLGDEAFADAGLCGQFSECDIFLGAFRLYLFTDQEEEFFVHVSVDYLIREKDSQNTESTT